MTRRLQRCKRLDRSCAATLAVGVRCPLNVANLYGCFTIDGPRLLPDERHLLAPYLKGSL